VKGPHLSTPSLKYLNLKGHFHLDEISPNRVKFKLKLLLSTLMPNIGSAPRNSGRTTLAEFFKFGRKFTYAQKIIFHNSQKMRENESVRPSNATDPAGPTPEGENHPRTKRKFAARVPFVGNRPNFGFDRFAPARNSSVDFGSLPTFPVRPNCRIIFGIFFNQQFEIPYLRITRFPNIRFPSITESAQSAFEKRQKHFL
jgi:hypothetical protein